MVGDQIRRELHRPLDSHRRFVVEQRGPFTLRHDPTHVAAVRAEKFRLNVEQDVRAFHALRNRESNLGALQDLA